MTDNILPSYSDPSLKNIIISNIKEKKLYQKELLNSLINLVILDIKKDLEIKLSNNNNSDIYIKSNNAIDFINDRLDKYIEITNLKNTIYTKYLFFFKKKKIIITDETNKLIEYKNLLKNNNLISKKLIKILKKEFEKEGLKVSKIISNNDNNYLIYISI